MELFFDTETSDKFDFKNPNYKSRNFPWCVQLGTVLAENGIAYAELNVIIAAGNRTIAESAEAVHYITAEQANIYGVDEKLVAKIFLAFYKIADKLVCHNFQFDSTIIAGLLYRQGFELDAINLLYSKPYFCTMLGATDFCKLPGKWGKYKWPKLQELHKHLFGMDFIGAHDAMFDIKATMKCFYELKAIGWIK